MGSRFCCPRCGSENVQNLQVIYQSGTSGSNLFTGVDKFFSTSNGRAMTELAKNVAPPTKKDTNWGWSIFLAIVAFVVWGSGNNFLIIVSLVFAGSSIDQSIQASDYNEKEWPKLYDTWTHSCLCHRCGAIFELREDWNL